MKTPLLASVLLFASAGLGAAAPQPVPGYPIGWCTRAQPAALDDAKSAGFEYVELALQDVLPLSEADFGAFAAKLHGLGLEARSGYNPLPADLRLVGPEADRSRQDAHLDKLLARARALGLKYLILNSAANWKVPDGVSREPALAQLAEFCGRFADKAAAAGVTVLLEPQRSRDTNLLTTVAEAVDLVERVNKPAFQLMVDYSFLVIQHDDPRALLRAGGHLRDVHISNPLAGRVYPMAGDETDYAWFFAALKQIGYRGGLSVHAATSDFAADAPRAIAFLRDQAAALAAPEGEAELLADDYRAMSLGMVSPGVVGAQAEYHYIATCAPKGNWSSTAFRSAEASQTAWRLVEDKGRRYLAQTYVTPPQERGYTHPIVTAGDDLWADYAFATRFAPEEGRGRAGVAFRYRTNRKYYFAGLIEGKAVLLKLNDGKAFRVMDETILAEQSYAPKPGEFVSVRVSAEGERLRAVFDGKIVLEARDGAFPQGRIALLADMPARFDAVRVTAAPAEARRFAFDRAERDTEEARLQAANPQMVLWKKIKTPGFGVGRNLRFGDLNGDGKLDILVTQVTAHGPADGYSETSCMTALDLDGKMLWQNGLPDSWKNQLTNDTAVQIHDLFGDGKNEVIYARDFELVVADGKTGKTLYKTPTPETPFDPLTHSKRFPRVLGDAIAFADLRGTGHRGDILLKDRYQNIWAFDDHLRPLWHQTLNTGHYPFPVDLDGSGKEDVMVGYSLVSPEGRVLWTNQNDITDHADGVAWVHFKPGDPLRLICNASDEGLFYADTSGKILKHYQIGHVQNVSVADYRPDLPGLEVASITFWANQGIVHLLDADGNIYKEFEPYHQGSMLSPVNWTGAPGEYWMLASDPAEGGLYDGWGRKVVRFPADGHPELCCAALDLTGDARDEIVVWDPHEIWIYTQGDNPKPGRLYKPARNSLSNWSNYQTSVSLPGWSR